MLFSPILNDDITLLGVSITVRHVKFLFQVTPGIYHFHIDWSTVPIVCSFSVIRQLQIIMLTTHDTNLYKKKYYLSLMFTVTTAHIPIITLFYFLAAGDFSISCFFSIFWTYLISDVSILLLNVKIYKHRKSPRNVWYI